MSSNFKDLTILFEKLSVNRISKYEDYIIKEGEFEEKFLVINHVYKLKLN